MGQNSFSPEEEKKLRTERQRNFSEALVFGVFIGFLICIAVVNILTYLEKERFYEYVQSMAILFVGFVSLLTIVIIYRNQILRFIFGKTKASLSEVTENGFDSLESILRGKPIKAITPLKKSLISLFALYSKLTFRAWVTMVIFSLSAMFVGTIGTILLVEQNKKIQSQNEVLETQSQLMETSFFTNNDSERIIIKKNYDDLMNELEASKKTKDKLIDSIKSSLSRMRPYWYYDSFYTHWMLSKSKHSETNHSITNTRFIPSVRDNHSSESRDDKNRIIFLSPERGLVLKKMFEFEYFSYSKDDFNRLPMDDVRLINEELFEFSDARGFDFSSKIKIKYRNYPFYTNSDIQINRFSCFHPYRLNREFVINNRMPDHMRRVDFTGALFHGMKMNLSQEFVKYNVLTGASFYSSRLMVYSEASLDSMDSMNKLYNVEFDTNLKFIKNLKKYILLPAEQGRYYVDNCLRFSTEDLPVSIRESLGSVQDDFLKKYKEIEEVKAKKLIVRIKDGWNEMLNYASKGAYEFSGIVFLDLLIKNNVFFFNDFGVFLNEEELDELTEYAIKTGVLKFYKALDPDERKSIRENSFMDDSSYVNFFIYEFTLESLMKTSQNKPIYHDVKRHVANALTLDEDTFNTYFNVYIFNDKVFIRRRLYPQAI